MNGQPRVYVNEERTVLVQDWGGGVVTVATRDTPEAIWGPPVKLTEERS